MGHPKGAHPGAHLNFDEAPFLVIWETTQACDLACKHCRAEAQPNRNPGELTTEEAKKLLDDVRRFGRIIFVFSGGDALKRPDIVELTEYGANLGLRMAITPATTPLATREMLQQLKDAGMARLAVSLDGSNPSIHDEFRQVQGSFDHGLRILKTAQEIGLSTQVNTVIRKHNLEDVDALCALMEQLARSPNGATATAMQRPGDGHDGGYRVLRKGWYRAGEGRERRGWLHIREPYG
ncbi:MAG: radical SAM protein [Gemmatimonadota bacterium]